MTTDDASVITSLESNGVLRVTLNRPQAMNAINDSMLDSLETAIRWWTDEPDVRAVIISGAGRGFSAGGDIKAWQQRTAMDGYVFANRMSQIFQAMVQAGKPTIAAVHGPCVGGGLELAMAATFIIAASDAKFGQPEIRVGTFPHAGGCQRLTRLVGRSRAAELILLGRLISPEEAERAGLVRQVVAASDLEATAYELAAELATMPPLATRLALAAIDAAWELPMSAGLELEASMGGLTYSTEDMREGGRAFLEKRPPRFSGR